MATFGRNIFACGVIKDSLLTNTTAKKNWFECSYRKYILNKWNVFATDVNAPIFQFFCSVIHSTGSTTSPIENILYLYSVAYTTHTPINKIIIKWHKRKISLRITHACAASTALVCRQTLMDPYLALFLPLFPARLPKLIESFPIEKWEDPCKLRDQNTQYVIDGFFSAPCDWLTTYIYYILMYVHVVVGVVARSLVVRVYDRVCVCLRLYGVCAFVQVQMNTNWMQCWPQNYRMNKCPCPYR